MQLCCQKELQVHLRFRPRYVGNVKSSISVFQYFSSPRAAFVRNHWYTTRGPFLKDPGNFSGPWNQVLVHLYLKTEKCMCLKLLVWREPLFILRICELHSSVIVVRDFGMALQTWKGSRAFEKRALELSTWEQFASWDYLLQDPPEISLAGSDLKINHIFSTCLCDDKLY